jgi:hypothetical protein
LRAESKARVPWPSPDEAADDRGQVQKVRGRIRKELDHDPENKTKFKKFENNLKII